MHNPKSDKSRSSCEVKADELTFPPVRACSALTASLHSKSGPVATEDDRHSGGSSPKYMCFDEKGNETDADTAMDYIIA